MQRIYDLVHEFYNRIPKRRSTVVILALLPPGWVALTIALLGLNFPFWDQWEFVPLLLKAEQQTLAWPDLVAQHNEHRPVVPRLLWLWLAWLTGYNTNAELWLNFALALVTFGLFVRYTLNFWRSQGVEPASIGVLVPVLSLLLFNVVQWESWLLGFQTVMYLGMLAVIAGILVLAQAPTWTGFAAAMLLGLVATYSMANALLYWPLAIVLIRLCAPAHRRTPMTVGAVMVGAAVVGVFLSGWTTGAGTLAGLLRLNPLTQLHWVLNFLGAPLLAYPPAFLFGILGLNLLLLALRRARNPTFLVESAAYWALLAFVLGTAGLISLGRSGGGTHLALAPRYITQSAWYWAALLALFPVLPLRLQVKQGLVVGMVVILGLSTLGGTLSGYKWRYLRTLPAYQAVQAGLRVEDSALAAIYGDVPPETVRARLDALCRNGWTGCAAPRPETAP